MTITAKKGRLWNADKYTGYVVVWSGNRRLYSKSTGIDRLTKNEALYDASLLKQALGGSYEK